MWKSLVERTRKLNRFDRFHVKCQYYLAVGWKQTVTYQNIFYDSCCNRRATEQKWEMRPRITRQQNPGPSSSQLHLSLELPRHDEQYENNDGINGAAVPVLKHILNVTGAKLPIKRSDIAKLCAGGNAELMVVITQVRNWLNDVSETNKKIISNIFLTYTNFVLFQQIYGYSLIEVNEEKNHFFLCVVKFMGYSYGDLGEEQQKIARLLFIVLSYIYMKGETVLEGNIQQYGLIHNDCTTDKEFDRNIVNILYYSIAI